MLYRDATITTKKDKYIFRKAITWTIFLLRGLLEKQHLPCQLLTFKVKFKGCIQNHPKQSITEKKCNMAKYPT